MFFWLFLVPPKLNTGMGNKYSSCHAVGWNFYGDQDPLVNDSFDVESPSKVQKYLDGAIAYKMEANERIRRDIQRLCHEARLERSVLIVSSLIAFAVVFLSIPKPKPSSGKGPSSDNGSSGESKSLSGDSSLGDGGPSSSIGSSSGKSKSEPPSDKTKNGED